VPPRTFELKASPLPPAYGCHQRLREIPAAGRQATTNLKLPEETVKAEQKDPDDPQNDAGQGRDAAAGETI